MIKWAPSFVSENDSQNSKELIRERDIEYGVTYNSLACNRGTPDLGECVEPPGECGADRIVGEEVIGGVKHYLFNWHPTPIPEHDTRNAHSLIKPWELEKPKTRK
jgi:hypothetical protein